MSRRSFLYRAGGMLLGLLGMGNRRACAARERGTTLTLLYTNDIHGHLTAWTGWEGDLKGKTIGGLGRLAGAIAEAKKEAKEALLLDAGDLLGDSLIADLTEGKAMVEALNFLGYDAMSIGNHEPDFGTAVLRQRMQDATFAVLAANLIERKGSEPFAQPYLIKKVSGLSVGILGLAYPKTPWTTAAKNVSDVEFQEPVPAVSHYLPQMRRDGADIIVVLSHLGLEGDKTLAKKIEGINVIVGGHSHNRMHRAEEVGDTLIVQAGAHGSDLGRLDLTIEQGKITANVCTLTLLDHDKVKADEAAERLLNRLLDPYRTELDEVIGQAADWLVRAQTLAGQEARKRDEESPIDSLFADILCEQTGADVALLPGVGYGVGIATGPITAAHLRQLVPHEGKVVTMRLTGTQIIEVLEQAIENVFTQDPAVKVGGMVQVGGIRFRYDSKQEKGQRIWHVEMPHSRWKPTTHYIVATNTMMAGGGHSYQTLTKGEGRAEHGSQYEMIRQWIAKKNEVATPPLGRIEKAPIIPKPR
jgi:5'-nucleotidase / UDP-sugar diphosphatase